MPLTTQIYTTSGTKKGNLTLPEALFGQPVKATLIAQALRVYQTRQRQGTKAVKTRSAVNYSTRKLWRQKGTGRARHGSRKAPIFVGGGIAHGPTGQEHYRLHMPQKMRRQAIVGALTSTFQNQGVKVLENLQAFPQKTQATAKLLQKIYPEGSPKILLVIDTPDPLVLRSTQQLKSVSVTQASTLNIYEIINHSQLLFTQAAIDQLASRYSAKSKI